MSRNNVIVPLLLLSACSVQHNLLADRPPLHAIVISVSSNVPSGSALHVAVDRPELNSLTTTGALRMYHGGGNQWHGRFAVQGSVSSTTVAWKLTPRTTNSSAYCNTSNGNLGGPSLTTNVPPWHPGYEGKTILYHSGLTNVQVLYRVGQTEQWEFTPFMTRIGPGRSSGEHRYRIDGVGEPGRPLEFVLRGYLNGVEQWDNPAVGGINNNYYTSLDFLFLQDGNIFNYEPPATVSAPQVVAVANWASSYTANGIPSRGGRIYLPRGYTQNSGKRYPVLYMHDGQNVFDPGGPFGSWSADAAATREISQGRMRESIIVAVNNTDNRMSEYGTPQDGYTGNFYLMYLVNNVMPAINASYRTLTNMTDTGVMGSSLGGLISAYCGLSTNRFGLIGAVSPSYWYGPNFRSWISSQPTAGRRIWQCAGSDEGSSMWNHFWPVYEYYLLDGYVVNDDLKIAIGCGEGHNEAAWANRVSGAFRFLFTPWDEANLLETNAPPAPPDLLITNPPGDIVVAESVEAAVLQGVANPAVWQGLAWSNSLTGERGASPIAEVWTLAGIPLGYGANVLTVSATNAIPGWQFHASDSSGAASYAGGWTNNSTGGLGFGPWQLAAGASAGHFIGAYGWGLWSQAGNVSEAVRPLSQPLVSGRRFRATLKNGFVNEVPMQSVGMALRDSGGGSLVQFYFNGGQAQYRVEDALGARNSGIGWTDQPQVIEIEVTSPTGYLLRVGSAVVSGVITGIPSQARFWSANGGAGSSYDFFIEELRVVSPIFSYSSTSDTVTITREGPSMHDGIPLAWWNRYGLGTNSSASADTDSDEATDGEEYVADTNPTNRNSFFSRVMVTGLDGDTLTLQAGPPTTNSRRYDVWMSTNLIPSGWTPFNINRPGDQAGGAILLTVTNTGERRYYRTGVKLP